VAMQSADSDDAADRHSLRQLITTPSGQSQGVRNTLAQ